MNQYDDVLAQRLNFDVPICCGCTYKEMQIIVIANLMIACIVLGCITKLLVNLTLAGIGLAFPVTVGLSWLSATLLNKLKDGKPKGYVKQSFRLWCEDNGLCKPVYLRRSGYWSVGR